MSSAPKSSGKNAERKWYVVDATDQVLGRLASRVALKLMGKEKPTYSPHEDHGDHIVVLNAAKVFLSGRKPETKEYFRHSKYPGGGKSRTYREQMEKDPAGVISHAVRGMIPKTTLGRQIFKKLHVYGGNEHPHASQKPTELSLK
ncbi:MAG: 50S ribosomal protein L13 [Chitinivibrionales bacterium]|nr:50S ribosomal protein L13 [Chitinivibrionales bacterium]MBD3358664.1 50S ribosomal protein L13 [Chitinivibrionales bacterium]